MKKFDFNEALAWIGGGAMAGASIATRISGSSVSELIGGLLGFALGGYFYYHSYREGESKRNSE